MVVGASVASVTIINLIGIGTGAGSTFAIDGRGGGMS